VVAVAVVHHAHAVEEEVLAVAKASHYVPEEAVGVVPAEDVPLLEVFVVLTQ
jgi:hypothetical protein